MALGAISTMGLLRVIAPVEPWKRASPKAKMPPSPATIQYPPPSGVEAMPTTGRVSGTAPIDPLNGALNEKMPPSDATSQYPPGGAVGGHANHGLVQVNNPVDP